MAPYSLIIVPLPFVSSVRPLAPVHETGNTGRHVLTVKCWRTHSEDLRTQHTVVELNVRQIHGSGQFNQQELYVGNMSPTACADGIQSIENICRMNDLLWIH